MRRTVGDQVECRPVVRDRLPAEVGVGVEACGSGWERAVGAKWEPNMPSNGNELRSTALNIRTLTCQSPVSAGQRTS